MSEIKFRAWDTISKRWLDTDEFLYIDGDFLSYDKYHQELGGIITDYVKVLQYTGLKDKNGLDIYEGDIVNDHYFKNNISRHKVYWADSYGCWSTINLKDPVIDRKQLGSFNEAKNLHRNEYLEVIGNIHENPELLKGGK